LSKKYRTAIKVTMPTRADILWLGLAAGVTGSLVGGLMLGLGLGLLVQGAHIGWLLLLPAAPVGGMLGYLLARKLVTNMPANKRR
jgi:hypothetical protein